MSWLEKPRATISLGRRVAGPVFGMGFLVLVTQMAQAPLAWAQFSGTTSLVNRSTVGALGDADSWAVDVSADGSMVVFASDAANLVPLDNNGDSDIFLRDTRTDITSRVSVNWQGKEAQGDSDCPSISSDGRFVTFRSRAWNLVQGGGNVGEPVWEVYLHDRQGPSTVRVSMPLGGGRATGESGCPVVSGDGAWVAFASAAPDLVADDTNGLDDIFLYEVATGELARVSVGPLGVEADGASSEPAISNDGRVIVFTSNAQNLTVEPFGRQWSGQVFAYDRNTQLTEEVSRQHPSSYWAYNGPSCCGKVSADGNLVMFHSISRMLLEEWSPREAQRLYVRDRQAGQTERIEPDRLDPWHCGDSCRNTTKGAAFSANGRFVAYLNGSFRLLPENPLGHYDQIYVHDRHTGRLRRVSVDPSGYPVRAYPCGGSSSTLALSDDGTVLALVGENAQALGLSDANVGATRDVVRMEWTCDPEEGGCRELSSCPKSPASSCESAIRSRLSIRRNPPATFRRDSFSWRWIGAGSSAPFVNPTEGDYQLCVYGGAEMSVQIDAGIPADLDWKENRKGWRLKDANGPIESAVLRNRRSLAIAKVRTTSPALDLPYLPLDASGGIRVQLHESSTEQCWEADFPPYSVFVNRRGASMPGGGVVSGSLRGLFSGR